jgi:hypothetical protein
MINPYLANELRRAQRYFRKAGQPLLCIACINARGDLADTRNPDETDAHRLIHLAFGGTIHA